MLAPAAQAQVVYSGILNTVIPNTGTGLFVNVVTGTTYTGPNIFPSCPGPGCGYDFNLFGSTSWSFFNPGTSGQPAPTPVAPTPVNLLLRPVQPLNRLALMAGHSAFANPARAGSRLLHS
ncbi:MAG: hypothetical protein MUE41_16250 [Gemmatimonadaceae bacterium]|nr:hypothetical protein [Gemmatimonadaceae bacterium]